MWKRIRRHCLLRGEIQPTSAFHLFQFFRTLWECSRTLTRKRILLSHPPSFTLDFSQVFVLLLPRKLFQMASILDSVATEDIERKKAALISRRCLVLALVGSTPSSVSSLDLILQNGYLSSVKAWMDDILGGSLGEFRT